MNLNPQIKNPWLLIIVVVLTTSLWRDFVTPAKAGVGDDIARIGKAIEAQNKLVEKQNRLLERLLSR